MKICLNLKLNKAVLIALLLPLVANAQPTTHDSSKVRENEKYLYPIKPGITGSLAGTMGELRTTHFHSGIDIRTNNQIGYPVQASKSGYISRVSVSSSGYGNVLYIHHPDGNTTLYAHLEQFNKALGRRVLDEQYASRSHAIDLQFSPTEFPVNQGDTVALSGNTGSSSGPHLHFDIRDQNMDALDPMIVGNFTEVRDVLPPVPERIAIKPMSLPSRVNDKFQRTEFYTFSRNGNNWSMASPILVHGLIGLELIAKDKLAPQSPFFGGVNYIEVLIDSQKTFSQSISTIPIADTRSIYTLMDFKTMRIKGSRFYKLYIDDGNGLDFYDKSMGTGLIKIQPGKEYSVVVRMRDSSGNYSTLSFRLRSSNPVKEITETEPLTADYLSELQGNVLVLQTPVCTEKTISYSKGVAEYLVPAYKTKARNVFLLDLKTGLPDSVRICTGKTYITHFQDIIQPGRDYTYYGPKVEISFPAKALYDTLYLRTYTLSTDRPVFGIADRFTPLAQAVKIKLLETADSLWTEKSAVYRIAGKGNYAYVGGRKNGSQIEFSTRELGEFTILKDEVAPVIKPLYIDKAGARFKIRDNLSGINTFDAYLNGEWVLLNHDAKSATFWITLQKPAMRLAGSLELRVTDLAGNQTTYKQIIK